MIRTIPSIKNGKKAIRFRRSLFWDIDPKNLDPEKYARYIIERILDFGNDAETRWMYAYYPHALIRDIAKKSRVLHPQTRPLWEALTRR